MSLPAPKQLLVALTIVAVLVANAITTPPPTAAIAESEQDDIGRLYVATFDRSPDTAGLVYWGSVLDQGVGLETIADYFVQSDEFQATYGKLDNAGFVTLVYSNVLGRSPDAAGLNYWVGLLDQDYSPGTILNGFAQSPEFARTQKAVQPRSILMIGDSIFHGIKLRRIPIGSANLAFRTEEGRQASTLPQLVDQASQDGSLEAADVVVIHLGTNGWQPEYLDMFDEQLTALAPKQVLIVNTEVARPWEAAANDALAQVSEENSNTNLIDWHTAVAGHPEWMGSDGVHPTTEGLRALAALIERRLSEIQ